MSEATQEPLAEPPADDKATEEPAAGAGDEPDGEQAEAEKEPAS